MQRYQLGMEEIARLQNELEEKVNQLEKIIRRAGLITSALTDYTTVVTAPSQSDEKINKIDEDDYILKNLNAIDLRSFGLIPELLGRFPIITYLEKLTKETMIKIMTEPKNSIANQFIELFKMLNELIKILLN